MNNTFQRILLWGGSLVVLAAIVLIIMFTSGGNELPGHDLTSFTRADWDHYIGAETPGVTLIEYSDFQCPACKNYMTVVAAALLEYPDDVGVVFRHFPLRSIHPQAQLAAQATEAASNQGAFWEYHDILYHTQSEWSGSPEPDQLFVTYAAELGLDVELFEADMRSDEVIAKVNRDYESAQELELSGTPTVFVNGERVTLGGYDALKNMIEDELERLGEVAEATISAEEGVGAEPVE